MSTRRDACARLLAVAVCVVPFLPSPAAAQDVSEPEQRAIRAVVEAQLAAFAADDARRAFDFASPTLREMFGSPDRFIAMVRRSYPVVYRHTSAIFLAPVRVEGQLVQGVNLTDARGGLWLAVYQFERQPDSSWRISGCVVQPSSGRMT